MSNKNMIRMGSHYRLDVSGTPDVVQSVESGVYTVRVTPDSINLQLKQLAFKQPLEILGKAKKVADVIASDFFSNPKKPLGAIFDGVKGSGKSMTAEIIANKAIEAGLPVVVIDSDYTSSLLQLLVSKIGPCVLLFDEFEKYYSKSSQKKLLSFFSDQANEGVLSIIITNDREKVTSYYIDRPGRFKYRVDFQNLDDNEMKSVLTSWGITGRMLTFFAAAYKGELSYDTLLTLKPFMVEATTPVDYIEKVELLNVPKPVIKIPNMKGAVYLRNEGEVPSRLRFETSFDSDLYCRVVVNEPVSGYTFTFDRVDIYGLDDDQLKFLANDDYHIAFNLIASSPYEPGRVYKNACGVVRQAEPKKEEISQPVAKEVSYKEGAGKSRSPYMDTRPSQMAGMAQADETAIVAALTENLNERIRAKLQANGCHGAVYRRDHDERAED